MNVGEKPINIIQVSAGIRLSVLVRTYIVRACVVSYLTSGWVEHVNLKKSFLRGGGGMYCTMFLTMDVNAQKQSGVLQICQSARGI